MSAYTFKPSPYSSHSLMLAALPERGDGRRVLDVGCGEGYLSAILASRGYEVTGVEPRRAANFPSGVQLIEADLDAGLPEVGGGYSFVICGDVLEHLREPVRLLHAVVPVLAPGGRLLASLPNSGNIYFRGNILLGRFPEHDRGLFDRTHLHFYMWENWRALLRAGGFEIETCRPTAIPFGLALDLGPAARVVERLSYDLARIWKTVFAYQFVVTARAAGR